MITIQDFENILFLEYFSLKKHHGNHSSCLFRAAINSNDISSFIGKVNSQLCIINGRRPIFFGSIDFVEVDKFFHQSFINVSATSYSNIIDEQLFSRIFQNPDKTFSDIFNPSRLNISNCNLQLDVNFSQSKVPLVILQNQETNFNFIKRLTYEHNFKMWIIDTKSSPEIKIANSIDDSTVDFPADDIIKLSTRHDKNLSSAQLTSKRFIDIGRIIKFNGIGDDSRKFLISSLELSFFKNDFFFTYDLLEFKNQSSSSPHSQLTINLKAKVINVNDPKKLGRIQVDFDIDDKDQNKLWIPFHISHSKTGGITFLPDVNDEVDILLSNGLCSAQSILCKQPINEKSLQIFAFDNKIILDDKKIELSVGNNSISIDANGIKLKTSNDEINLSNSTINIKSNTVKIADKVELS